MIRADEAVPRADRRPFILGVSGEGADLLHEGLQPGEQRVLEADLDVLVRNGMLSMDFGGHGTPNYTVTPEGRRYATWLMTKQGGGLDRSEDEIRRWLDGVGFRGRHPEAYARWESAESALWNPDEPQPTTVGHTCREALQLFASDLVRHTAAEVEANPNVASTVSRLRTAINASTLAPTLKSTRRSHYRVLGSRQRPCAAPRTRRTEGG